MASRFAVVSLMALWANACAPQEQAKSAEPPEEVEAPTAPEEETQDSPDDQDEATLADADLEQELALTALREHLEHKPETSRKTPLSLSVFEQGAQKPWVMGIVNGTDEPMKVVADPRLLRLEVRVPGKKKPVMCELPAQLRPARAMKGHEVVVGPGEGLVKSFDPRLYCFTSAGQTVLVPGSIITARFGWAKATKKRWEKGTLVEVEVKQSEPFVAQSAVAPPQAATAETAETTAAQAESSETEGRLKELAAAPFALGSSYAQWAEVGLRKPPVDEPPIVVDMQQGSDAYAERDATVAITLKNREKQSQRIYFRRELMSFEVFGPSGSIRCDPQPDERAPDPQAFLYLRPGQSMSITSRLIELCPKGTFGHPGFYLVHGRLDAEQTGEEFGIDAYVGRLATTKPANIRIRTGELTEAQKQVMFPLAVHQPAD